MSRFEAGPPGAGRSVAEHARIVRGLLAPTEVVDWGLPDVLGLALADDITAAVALPPFDNSAMDGYAVHVGDLSGLPVVLPVQQDIPAGCADVRPLPAGSAARIMTGAPMPPGADAVVPVELTDGGTDRVRIDRAVPLGRNIRLRGSDVESGAVVLTAGTTVHAQQIGLIAALGRPRVAVRRPARVLVLSTGSELVEPGGELGPGQIYESNAPMLAAALRQIGAEPTVAHFVADDVESFDAALADAAAGVDLVLTSGGVSAGAYEVVKDALAGRGVEFAKVAMQPGMPQGAGRVLLGGRHLPVITLPGNPVSSFVSFEVFVRPALLAAMGHRVTDRARVRAMLAEPITSVPGKTQYLRGHLDGQQVTPWGGPGSHLLGRLAGADCLLVIPSDVTELPAGAAVDVWQLAP